MYEQQTKLNVEFKPAKKMKKRRQLDALVGNGKARRKTKNGHEALPVGSETESSEIDEFNISDQNTLLRKSRHSSSCSLCSSIFGLFTLAACLIGCGALFWMHFKLKQSIDEVKEKMFEVQAKNGERVGSYNQDLKTELAKLKKTVDSYTTGSNGIADMHKHLDDISKKIVALNASTQSLRDLLGLKSSAEFQETIKKVPILSKNVATLGVDVKSLQKTVTSLEAFRQSTDQQIKAWSSKMDNNKPVTVTQLPSVLPQNAMSPEIANQISKKFEELRDDLEKSNSSIHSELAKIKVVLDGHKDKFAVIDDTTEGLKKKLDKMSDHQNTQGSSESKGQDQKVLSVEEVKVIVHQMVQDMGVANSTSNADDTNLQALIENMDNVTNIVHTLRTKLVKMETSNEGTGNSNTVDNKDFVMEVQTMNKTVVHLEADLMTLMQKVTQQQNKLVNISHTVDTIHKFVAEIQKDHTSIRTDISKMSGSTSSLPLTSLAVSSTTTPSPTLSETNSSSRGAATMGQKEVSSTSGAPTVSETPARNYPPLANTAGRLTVHLPLTELVLDATNSTDDKAIVKYRWEQMRGPSQLTLTDEDKANTTATGDIQVGLYIFAVQVWDQEHLSSEIRLYVDVKPPLPGSESGKTTPVPEKGGLHRYINMSLVKSMDDLDLGVRRWDRNGDGFVEAEDLQDYMPDPPKPKELEKFDFDHNGKYDINELAVALGFKPWPSTGTAETNGVEE